MMHELKSVDNDKEVNEKSQVETDPGNAFVERD